MTRTEQKQEMHLFVDLLCLLFLIPRENCAQAPYIYFILWRTFSVHEFKENERHLIPVSLYLYLSMLSCIR